MENVAIQIKPEAFIALYNRLSPGESLSQLVLRLAGSHPVPPEIPEETATSDSDIASAEAAWPVGQGIVLHDGDVLIAIENGATYKGIVVFMDGRFWLRVDGKDFETLNAAKDACNSGNSAFRFWRLQDKKDHTKYTKLCALPSYRKDKRGNLISKKSKKTPTITTKIT